MTASITLYRTARTQYLLRIADTCLIHAHRLSQWCGHAPVLEEDIALTNMALDMLGQARVLLSHVGAVHAQPDVPDAGEPTPDGGGFQQLTEDQLAYLRDERDFFNVTLVELPNGPAQPGDFAFTVLRNHAVATWLHLLWQALSSSSDGTVAAIAAKAVKEARYHESHAADWVIRLGDGTDESAARMRAALQRMWPYITELFVDDEVDAFAQAQLLGPRWSALQSPWRDAVTSVYAHARLAVPADGPFLSTGRSGRHSEHMGFILSDLQHLQRAYPGGVW